MGAKKKGGREDHKIRPQTSEVGGAKKERGRKQKGRGTSRKKRKCWTRKSTGPPS